MTLVAAALRLWRLDQLPPGLHFDEAFNGLDARAVAAGDSFPLYFPANNGREPLYIYLQALAVATLGPSAYALRMTSALIGIATVPLTYWGARSVLNGGVPRSYWPALAAAAGLAVSYWHVSLSRLAFRAVLLPPLSLLAVVFLWRGWTDGRRRDFIWSGVWFGAALYSYTAARLLPLAAALFVLVEIVLELVRRREGWQTRLRRRTAGIGWLVGAALVVSLPLLSVFAGDPAQLAARTGDVSIFTVSPVDMPGTPAQRAARNATAIARSFYDRGDLNLRHNLPGRPVQDWLLAALFTIGWLGALWRVREAHMRLILIWFGVMALPSLLSVDAPHALRMAGMLPPLTLFYGVGVQTILGLGARRPRMLMPAGAAILAGILIVSGGITARDYFARWAAEPELGRSFDLDLQIAAQAMAAELEAVPTTLVTTRRLWLTPQMRYALGEIPVTPPSQEDVTDAQFLVEENVDPWQPLYLITADASGPRASWVQAEHDEPSIVDAERDLSTEELTWPGQQPQWPVVRRSPLPPDLRLHGAAPRYALDVTFANGLQLMGYDVIPDGVTTESAEPAVRLATYWQLTPERAPTERPTSTETFDLFAHLLLPDGAQEQENGNLGRGFPIDLWQAGQIVDDRRAFAVPADAAAGKAFFELGLYDPAVPAGAKRIPIVDAAGAAVADHVRLGAVAVDRQPPQVALDDLTPLDARVDADMALLGWRATLDDADPTTLSVDLAWQALDRPASDFTAFVHLLDPDGAIVVQFDQPPGGLDNPTSRWLPGEQVRTTFPLREIPSVTTEYALRIGLYEPVSGRQLSVTGADAEDGATFVLIPLEELP